MGGCAGMLSSPLISWSVYSSGVRVTTAAQFGETVTSVLFTSSILDLCIHDIYLDRQTFLLCYLPNDATYVSMTIPTNQLCIYIDTLE